MRPQVRGSYKRAGAFENVTGEGNVGKTWRRDPTFNPDVSDAHASSSKEANHQKFRSAVAPSVFGECLREGLAQALRGINPYISLSEVDRTVGKLKEMYDVIHEGNTVYYNTKLHRSVKLDEVIPSHIFRELLWWNSMPKHLDNVLKEFRPEEPQPLPAGRDSEFVTCFLVDCYVRVELTAVRNFSP